MPEAGRIASGRGLTLDRAELSCLGEAAELLSACRWGDEHLRMSSFRDVAPVAIHPAKLLLANDEQYDRRAIWNTQYGGFDWMPERLDETAPIEWVEVASPDGSERALVPAACAFIGYLEPGDAGAFAVADSNGCAAGDTLEQATVSAFLELVERDATALWWYGRHARPAIDLGRVEAAGDLAASLATRKRLFHVLDLTSDLGVPVCAAVSAEPDGTSVAIGVAADFDVSRAVLSALTEMVQIEFSLGMRRLAPTGSLDAFGFWLENVTLHTAPHLLPARGRGHDATQSGVPIGPPTVDNCSRIVRDAGLQMFVLDLTRPGIGVPVARVIVPGMRPCRCRLAPGRLFDVPARLGWRPVVQTAGPDVVPLSI